MGRGIQWYNISQGARPNDNFTFLYCMIMMVADSVIYIILTVYIGNVYPGNGKKKKETFIQTFCLIY